MLNQSCCSVHAEVEDYKARQLLQAFTARPLKRKSASLARIASNSAFKVVRLSDTSVPIPIAVASAPPPSLAIEHADAELAALLPLPSHPEKDMLAEEANKTTVEEMGVKAVVETAVKQEAIANVAPGSNKKSKTNKKKPTATSTAVKAAAKVPATPATPKAAHVPSHSPVLPARHMSAAIISDNTSSTALAEAKMQVRLLIVLAIMLQVDKLSMQQQAKVKEAELSVVKEQLKGAHQREIQLVKQSAAEAEAKAVELSSMKAQLSDASSREVQLLKQVAMETEARQATEREVAGDHARRLLKDTKAELTQYQKLLGAADAERESLSSRIKELETRTKELEREKKVLAKRQKELLPFAVDQSQTLFEPHSPTARSTVIEPCTPLRGSLVDAAAFLRKDSVTQYTIGSQVVYDNGNTANDDPNKFRCSIRATRAWLAYLAKNSPRGQKKTVILQPAAIIYERPPWKPAGYC
jgi:hypothetical protein